MLTKDQLTSAKKKLEETKTDLEKQIKNVKETPEFGSDVDHFEEEANEAEETGKNIGMEQAFKERYEAVVHALDKVEKGTYGKCEKCGNEIEWELLNVDPESRLCKKCKADTR